MIDTIDARPESKAVRQLKKRISEQAQRANVAEQQVRDLSRDRDQWKSRAQAAEATLQSFGRG